MRTTPIQRRLARRSTCWSRWATAANGSSCWARCGSSGRGLQAARRDRAARARLIVRYHRRSGRLCAGARRGRGHRPPSGDRARHRRAVASPARPPGPRRGHSAQGIARGPSRAAHPVADRMGGGVVLFHLLAPLSRSIKLFNLVQLHHLSGGRRIRHVAAGRVHRRAGDPPTPARDGGPSGRARGHTGHAPRKQGYADHGWPDHPGGHARSDAASGRSSTTVT